MMAESNKRDRGALTRREQRVARVMGRGFLAVIIVALFGVGIGVVAQRTGSDFLSGMQSGLMTGLPWAVLLMVWGGYRQMDEYGKLNLLRASSVAFAAVMLTAMTYFPLEQALKWPPMPLWVLWMVGWAVWGVALAVSGRSREN